MMNSNSSKSWFFIGTTLDWQRSDTTADGFLRHFCLLLLEALKKQSVRHSWVFCRFLRDPGTEIWEEVNLPLQGALKVSFSQKAAWWFAICSSCAVFESCLPALHSSPSQHCEWSYLASKPGLPVEIAKCLSIAATAPSLRVISPVDRSNEFFNIRTELFARCVHLLDTAVISSCL